MAQSHQFTPEAAPPALITPKEMELARIFRKHTTMADGVLGGGPVGPRSWIRSVPCEVAESG